MRVFLRVLLFIVTIMIPFFLIMTSVRILLNPFFLEYEYGQRNFPEDEFGFTKNDRLKWGKVSLVYLTNHEDISYLADLKFDDGTALYNERELSHMLDVKNLVQAALKVWYLLIGFLAILAFMSWRLKLIRKYCKALGVGGWITLGLILLILAGVLIDFDALFRGFHAIFFTGDTWLFFETDTLIRLFPEKLWSDAFIFMGIFTLVSAIVLAMIGSKCSDQWNKETGS